MRVNEEYIASAGQADEFRTEPAFKLQGSYRNMNRLAEKVVAIMNDDEVRALVMGHYRGESQTLTTGAEANLLRFKELINELKPEEVARWAEIKKTFKRNQFTRGGDQGDPVGRVVTQLAQFQSGLESIQTTLEHAASRPKDPVVVDLGILGQQVESLRTVLEERLTRVLSMPAPVAPPPVPPPIPPPLPVSPTTSSPLEVEKIGVLLGDGLRSLGMELSRAIQTTQGAAGGARVESLSHEMEMIHSTLATLKDLAAQQRDHLRTAEELLVTRAKQGTIEVEVTQEMLANERAFMERVHQVLEDVQKPKS